MTTLASPGPLAKTALALQTRLQVAFPPALFAFDFVPAKVTKETWRKLTRKTPFIGIGWADIEGGRNLRFFQGESRWSVFLATKNTSGILGRYFGDALAPGLFTMVEAATAALQGFTIPDVGSTGITRGSNVFVEGWDDEDMVVATLDVTVGLTIRMADVLLNVGDEGEFNELSIDWNFGAGTVLSDAYSGLFHDQGQST